jgi:hypothetical protein
MVQKRSLSARALFVIGTASALLLIASGVSPGVASDNNDGHKGADSQVRENVGRLIEEGRHTFRYDTFGDEAFWGDKLKLHLAIAGAKQGGVGPGVSPATALSVGLKVDVNALPEALRMQIATGKVDLTDPAVTLALLKLNAVVGVTGIFDNAGRIASMGIQCALCHSTVDNSFAPGIGHRLDGWANRDLNVGAIIALAPDLSLPAQLLGVDQSTVRTVLNTWGPGKFDAELFLDGKPFQPSGRSAAALIPPAFGQAGVNLGTWTGFGSTTYWNALVANLEMHGKGTFYDPRLNDPVQYPVAVKAGSNDVRSDPDLITSKLAALHFYQLAIPAPKPSVDSMQNHAASRGKGIFTTRAQCARCHVPPLFTEPGYNMHTPEEVGIDDFQSSRSPTKMYRTAPLKGLFTHEKGGFYHDGRFATLQAVVDHYDNLFGTGLSQQEKDDLIAYLRTL